MLKVSILHHFPSSIIITTNFYYSNIDGTKIPILMEQQKEYRYMYSLKKESATRDLFKKFKIIKCKDTMVGIKPLVTINPFFIII